MKITKHGRTTLAAEMQVVVTPVAGIGKNEAIDKWLGADKNNKVLDYGDNSEPVLLVGNEKTHMVHYELIPELSQGITIEQAMKEMRQAGMDVRGVGPKSIEGNPTIIVCEIVNKGIN